MTGVGDSYVFKSSKKMGQLAINMDQSNEFKNVLMEEPAYFDGMHRRCEGWKTLTLWVYHPNPKRLYRLATMEVKGETSKSVAKFWEVFNSMLSEITGKENYKFNPKLWVTDEAGANFNGLKQIYTDSGNKTVTCQFHFKQCLRRILNRFPPELPELRQEFEELMLQLLTVTTIQEYNDISGRLKEIASLVPAAATGLNWWLARRYNLFPVFRGYCITSLNLAEIGHSTLKRKKPLNLVDAAWEDVCTSILQEQEHTAFLSGRTRNGKGPSTTELAMESKRQQLKRSKDYQNAFKNKDFNVAGDGGYFVKHRPNEDLPPNVQGDEENLDIPRLQHMREAMEALERNTTQPTRQQQQQQQPSSSQVIPNTQSIPEQYNITDNPPLLCFWSSFTKKCYGCKNDLFNSRPQTPNDIILKMLVVRDRPTRDRGWIRGWKRSWGYFHLNINCLRLEKPVIEIEDIYLPNDTKNNMQAQHRQKLENMGWWDRIKMR